MTPLEFFLVGVAIKSAIVLVPALLAACFLRERNAVLKHLVLTCAFGACLALPVAQLTIRPREVSTPIQVSAVKETKPSPAPDLHINPTSKFLPPQRSAQAAPFALVWLAGSSACLLFWVLGRIRAWTIYRAATPFESAEAPRHVRMACGASPQTAVTWGLFRSVILLPAASRLWSPRELCSALEHEMAHVRRRDDLAHAIGWLAASINWFNPLFWIALRAQRLAAELAADAAVASRRSDPADYAQDLLSIASRPIVSSHLPPFGVTIMNSNNIEYRIKAILAGRAPGRAGALTLIALLATATVAVATLGPLRSQGANMPGLRSGQSSIEHLTNQDLELGHSSHVVQDRPRLIFFGDFECGSCRKIADSFERVRDSGYGVIYVHFPLKYHPHARLAAQAMIAASRQGAEWQAMDHLFAMALTNKSIRDLGKALGINERRFVADLDAESTKQRVEESYDLAIRLKLNKVPTFVKVNPDGSVAQLEPSDVSALAHFSSSK